jgi:hypothetical protein
LKSKDFSEDSWEKHRSLDGFKSGNEQSLYGQTEEFDHKFRLKSFAGLNAGYDWCNVKLDIAVTFRIPTAIGGGGRLEPGC